MTVTVTRNRRAEELERLLASAGRTDDPVVGPLVAVVEALREVPAAPAPRPEFRVALRQRVVAVATVQGVGTPVTPSAVQRARAASRTWRVQRRLLALAAGAAVVTGVTGVGLGASRSLPGDPFYGVKRATENAQLAATTGTEARGRRHLEFARTRLDEVADLARTTSSIGPAGGLRFLAGDLPAAGGSANLIVDTLHDMDVQTRDGANDLFAAYRSSGSVEPLRLLGRFATGQYDRLTALLPALPTPARAAAQGSLALLTVVARETARAALLPTVAPTGSSGSTPAGTIAPTAVTVTPTPGATSPRPGGTATPGTGSGSATQPVQLPTPSVSTSLPVQLPTIPPLPRATGGSMLPSELPSLPDLSGLLGH